MNRLHGLENDQDIERVILKCRMLITIAIETMIKAVEGDKEIMQLASMARS